MSVSVGYFRRVQGNFNVHGQRGAGAEGFHAVQRDRADRLRACPHPGRRSRASTTRTPSVANRQRDQGGVGVRRAVAAIGTGSTSMSMRGCATACSSRAASVRQDDDRQLRHRRRRARGAEYRGGADRRSAARWARRERLRRQRSAIRSRHSSPTSRGWLPIRCRTASASRVSGRA